jgi:hypothetical protein
MRVAPIEAGRAYRHARLRHRADAHEAPASQQSFASRSQTAGAWRLIAAWRFR